MTALLPGICLFWLGAAYKLRLVSYGHKTAGYCLQGCSACLFVDFWGFCSIIPGMAHKFRPHLDYCLYPV